IEMLPGIGMFGTGEVTHVLVPILRDKGFNIVAIWGRTGKEAEQAAVELKIPFHTAKIDDVLLRKDVDLVFITCPPFLHSQISVKARTMTTLAAFSSLRVATMFFFGWHAQQRFLFRAAESYRASICFFFSTVFFTPLLTYLFVSTIN
uniref:Gfo/Idh/MocA-like oxidoreductase N-terminal domain-containing protein n=1 Tax=Anopheles atroparvus TaxID=41427 RepID=A0AAG5DH78_ANOAO